jgi:mannose-6-phosphate isomerase-like protein (cupin superfamily)
MSGIEEIRDGSATLAYVIRWDATSDETAFFTSDDSTFQAGFVVYPAGGRVPAHVHLPVVRQVVGTSELLVVRSGRCTLDIYADDRRLVASRDLVPGDAVLSVGGGHGFRMTQDTVLFEVKQGPYGGLAEKERFEPEPDPGSA